MKIALASSHVITKNVAYNTTSALHAMEQCGGQADLVVFGESMLQGFESLSWDYETDCGMALSLDDPRLVQIRNAAKQNHLAVSFGFIEKEADALFSSQLFVGAEGEIIDHFHRVSEGWKAYWQTDAHYREGEKFRAFSYGGKTFSVGLCGDLWTEGRPEEMKSLHPDVVLWPVWCDFDAREWNETVKYEYARQAALCGDLVLYVNPFCTDAFVSDAATGGAACFKKGRITSLCPAGKSDILWVSV